MPYKSVKMQNAFQKRWITQRRAEWFAAHGPCADCASPDNLRVKYVDPSTKITHRVWSWKDERRNAELAKCVAVCGGCYTKRVTAEKTARQTKPLVHGTKHGYLAHDCRCEPCRKALSTYRKTYRKAA